MKEAVVGRVTVGWTLSTPCEIFTETKVCFEGLISMKQSSSKHGSCRVCQENPRFIWYLKVLS
jgi:hypothetical protein